MSEPSMVIDGYYDIVSTGRIPEPPKPRTVYDLKRQVDRHGEEIFIQRECESSGEPMLCYKFDR